MRQTGGEIPGHDQIIVFWSWRRYATRAARAAIIPSHRFLRATAEEHIHS